MHHDHVDREARLPSSKLDGHAGYFCPSLCFGFRNLVTRPHYFFIIFLEEVVGSMIIVPDRSSPPATSEAITAKVQKVFDGDGFLASVWNPRRQAWIMRIPFRMAFIDAPETEQPFGPEAREFLKGLISGKSLSLVPVLKGSTAPSFFDPYQRVLCVPFLTELMEVGRIQYYSDGCCAAGSVRTARQVTRNIELEMVVNGWAWVIRQYAFDHEAEYLAAQNDARRNRRGLWSKNNPEPPGKFKSRQKGGNPKLASQGCLL